MQTPPEDRRARKARTLLTPVVPSRAGTWADLGCGDGVFTLLLDDAAFLSLAARVGLVQPEIRARAPSTFLGEMYTGVAFRPAIDQRLQVHLP